MGALPAWAPSSNKDQQADCKGGAGASHQVGLQLAGQEPTRRDTLRLSLGTSGPVGPGGHLVAIMNAQTQQLRQENGQVGHRRRAAE